MAMEKLVIFDQACDDGLAGVDIRWRISSVKYLMIIGVLYGATASPYYHSWSVIAVYAYLRAAATLINSLRFTL